MRRSKAILISLVSVLVLLLVGCRTPSPFAAVPSTPVDEQPIEAILTDLETIDQLQTQFNNDAGKPRLLMILAPT